MQVNHIYRFALQMKRARHIYIQFKVILEILAAVAQPVLELQITPKPKTQTNESKNKTKNLWQRPRKTLSRGRNNLSC